MMPHASGKSHYAHILGRYCCKGIAASQVPSAFPFKIKTRSVIVECCLRPKLGHTEHVLCECIADGVLRSSSDFNDGRRFVFLPLLYELVTGELQDWEVAPVFTDLLAGTDITFVQGKVCPPSSGANCSCTSAKVTSISLTLISMLDSFCHPM